MALHKSAFNLTKTSNYNTDNSRLGSRQKVPPATHGPMLLARHRAYDVD